MAAPPPIRRLGFDHGLEGWDLSVVGGSASGRGSVTVGSAILREGDSFLVSLEHAFQVSEHPAPLVFTFTDLHFDRTDPDFINDAFEATLVDADGRSLVHTIGTGRTAFFNITEGEAVVLGAGASIAEGDVRTVTVDLTRVPAGTHATLQFRLVNNDADTESTVRILDVLIPGADDPPAVDVTLLNDTAPDDVALDHPYRSDGLTQDATVHGTATDDVAVVRLEASVDGQPHIDITDRLIAGAFTFDPGSLPAGAHRITLVATDSSGQTAETHIDFRKNAPPTARAGGAQTVAEGASITWDGSSSTDDDDEIHSYRWTFDGVTVEDGAVVSRTYADSGDLLTTLTVIDTAGAVASDSVSVTVLNVPPVAAISAPATGVANQPVTVFVSANDPSPDDMQSPFIYEIDWDGDALVDETVAGPASGLELAHTYAAAGDFTIVVTAMDQDAETGPAARHRVTVVSGGTAAVGGYVYVDVNNNGIREASELGLPNVPIALAEASGELVARTTTDVHGWYEFRDLPPGRYHVLESQAAAFLDGKDTPGVPRLGSVANDEFRDLALSSDTVALDYNFGEMGLIPQLVSKQLLLASTPQGQAVMPWVAAQRGAGWFTFVPGLTGELAVSLNRGADQPVVELYTSRMMPIVLSRGEYVLASAVAEGEQYVLHIAGVTDDGHLQASLVIQRPASAEDPQARALDVNRDGWVSPLDALLVINQLNGERHIEVQVGGEWLTVDVNRDTYLTPIDALLVINYVNQRSSAEGEETDNAALAAGSDEDVDNAAEGTKFFVVDALSGATFRYASDGRSQGSLATGTYVHDPRGVASNRDGTRLWTVSSDHTVHVFDAQGTHDGSWAPDQLSSPQGIATDGTDLWVVDRGDGRIHYFAEGGARTFGTASADAVYLLHVDNRSPSDLVARDGVFWVTDDLLDQVFVYDAHDDQFRYLGRWSLDAANADASGIALDPSGASDDLWVVDRVDRLVYAYVGGTTWRGGNRAADSSFALAIGNSAPEGIADPPVLTLSEPVHGDQLPVGQPLVISGQVQDPSGAIPTVRVNGQTADVVDPTGQFFHRAQVTPGSNVFEVEATDGAGDTVSSSVTVEAATPPAGTVDFRRLSVVSGSTLGVYGRTSWHEASTSLHVDLRVENTGRYAVDGPVLVGVANISDPSVRLRETDGTTPDGIPYLDMSSRVSGGSLQPGDISDLQTISFFVPGRTQFTYDLVFFAGVNQPPRITTVPPVEALNGQAYVYDAEATDPDGGVLQFSLLSSPDTMTVDANTGRIVWSPTSDDRGTHTVIVHVDDGRGGTAQQQYVLSVIETPPNRPPFFATVPVVDAVVGTPYEYDADAIDPDDDALIYQLAQAVTDVIDVANPGFEAQVLSEGAATAGVLTGWVVAGGFGGGAFNPTANQYPGGAVPQGQNVAYSIGPAISQVLTATLQPRTRYALTVAVGDRLDTAAPSYAVQLWAGGEMLAASTQPQPANGAFVDITAIFESGTTHPALGEPLEIRLLALGSQVNWDHVRLIASGMLIDADTGKVTWTPQRQHMGTHEIALQVSDGRGGTALQAYSIRVEPEANNRAPVIVSTPTTSVVAAVPPEVQTIRTITFEGLPAAASFSQSSPVRPEARLSDQFLESHGVTFSSASGIPYVAVVPLGAGHAHSGVNGIGGMLTDTQLDYATPIHVQFSLPDEAGTGYLPAVTDFVSIKVDTAGVRGTVFLEAYDVNGNLLERTSAIDLGGPTLSLSTAGIHTAKIRGTSTTAFDDLS
ncbi:MAG: PKD domain-containing protein, partial [Pirellulaceae bacterium]|nr:PKD domain-containing protein [Pirellulaceae bacterium]